MLARAAQIERGVYRRRTFHRARAYISASLFESVVRRFTERATAKTAKAVGSVIAPPNYLAKSVAMPVADKRFLLLLRPPREFCAKAAIEAIIGDIVVRAGGGYRRRAPASRQSELGDLSNPAVRDSNGGHSEMREASPVVVAVQGALSTPAGVAVATPRFGRVLAR